MDPFLRIVVAAVLCLPGLLSHAQDTLYYANGNLVVGKVDEVGLEQVHYRAISGETEVKITAEKKDLSRVVLSDGQVLDFRSASYPLNYPADIGHKKNVIKIDFIAPALNHFVIGYERVIKERINLDIKVGYIGLQSKDHIYDFTDLSGVMVKAGVKFYYRSQRVQEHPLTGWYLKPEFIFTTWSGRRSYNYYEPYGSYPQISDKKSTVTSGAFQLNIGRQIRLGRSVTLEIFSGIGYSIQDYTLKERDNYYYDDFKGYTYSHAQFGPNMPLSVSGGLMFGYAF